MINIAVWRMTREIIMSKMNIILVIKFTQRTPQLNLHNLYLQSSLLGEDS